MLSSLQFFQKVSCHELYSNILTLFMYSEATFILSNHAKVGILLLLATRQSSKNFSKPSSAFSFYLLFCYY